MSKAVRFLFLTVVGIALLFHPQNIVLAREKIGILLMHGKGGTARAKSPIGKLTRSLKGEGYVVLSPDMPWSRSRIWDGDFDDAMVEIDGYVEKLKQKGATKIVAGGHSLGANVAIGYGARREGLAGILAIAPGHVPELEGFQKLMDFDYRRARKMVDEGKGDVTDDFKDINQGKRSEVSATAKQYLSWYDPEGAAVMPKNLPKLNAPLMWIVGEKDIMVRRNRSRKYFDLAPANSKNSYDEVEGGHRVTPMKGDGLIIGWLLGL